MTITGPSRPPRRGGRILATTLLTLLIALTLAGTIDVLPPSGHVAVGWPLPVQQGYPDASRPDSFDEVAAARTSQPLTASVSFGPHLTVPILYYHYIRTVVPSPRNSLSFNLSISPGLFAQQMALLHVENAAPITLAMLMEALAGRRSLPPHPVVLTFDDGYADFATAAQPVLARYGFVATDFVVSAFIGRPRYMTAAQIRNMDAAGMVIGAHTVHHLDLTAVSPAVARAEIADGRAALEALLHHPVLDFAYPYGRVNAGVARLVQQARFRDAVTTASGAVQALGGRYLLRRRAIGGAPTLASFAVAAGLPPPTAAQAATIHQLAP